MAGKRNLLRGSENADLDHRRLIRRGKHEHGLGEIHFTGDLLQLEIGQARGIRDHRHRIAAEGHIGEDIRLVELKRASLGDHGPFTLGHAPAVVKPP